jgi:DNA-binding MarR family transcriptional regulator
MTTKEKYNQFSVTKALIQTKLTGYTPTAKAIIITLISYMSKDKKSRLSCTVGHGTIAELVGSTRDTVISTLKRFEKDGFIKSEKRYDNSKIYTWIGITEKEREFNSTKVKRSQDEWDAYRKNKPNIDKLEADLIAAKASAFDLDT